MELISRLQHRSRRRTGKVAGEGDDGASRRAAIRKALTSTDVDGLTPALGAAARRGSVPAVQHGAHAHPAGLGAQTSELRSSSLEDGLLNGAAAVPKAHGGSEKKKSRRDAAPRRGPPPAPPPAPAGRIAHDSADKVPLVAGPPGRHLHQYADALEHACGTSSSDDEGPPRHVGARACGMHAGRSGGASGLQALRKRHRTLGRLFAVCVVCSANCRVLRMRRKRCS